MAFEGDTIRPLGLVTLNAGYAEAELDELLAALGDIEIYDDRKRQWPVGQKLRHAKNLVGGLKPGFTGLVDLLDEATRLFDRRNALVHSAIYSGTKSVVSRVSGSEQDVSADALTKLASSLSDCRFRIRAFRQRTLEPWLAQQEP